MPNLESLKKQAKLILRWHRDRYYPVAAQIRTLPRYRHLADADILAQSFRLADAQELVARQQGFESWHALKSGLPVMTDHAAIASSRATLVAAEPQLFVAEIARSCAFFTEKLGFTVAFTYGEPPFYAQVVRDNARLNLRCVDTPVIGAERGERESLLSATITVATSAEIKQLFLDFQATGVSFFQPLKRQPWGARLFIAKDPDGNLIEFAGPGE